MGFSSQPIRWWIYFLSSVCVCTAVEPPFVASIKCWVFRTPSHQQQQRLAGPPLALGPRLGRRLGFGLGGWPFWWFLMANFVEFLWWFVRLCFVLVISIWPVFFSQDCSWWFLNDLSIWKDEDFHGIVHGICSGGSDLILESLPFAEESNLGHRFRTGK